jgi:hypothetical protein
MSDINPLYKITGYDELKTYFEENKEKDWKEWLEFDALFNKPGKQGIVGLFRLTKDKDKSRRMVFKMSQYINYLTEHEFTVMNGLNDISSFCPHFCKTLGTIECKVDPTSQKHVNPFHIQSHYPITKQVLLCEYVNNSTKFYNYIRASREKIPEMVLYSTVKQVLMAVTIAQKEKKFTHYDLHSCNIMMRKCNKNVVFLYVLDEENQFAVPTHGHYPVIIDFGFSYISDMDDGPLWPSMAHTDVGFMSDRFDWVADPKLFLVTVSQEIKEKRQSRLSRKFRRVVENIFTPLNIDWASGWDKGVSRGASDCVGRMLRSVRHDSKIFREYDHYCIDLLQTLVILPIEEQDCSNIKSSFEIFVQEFSKIESQISSPFYNICILKGIVDTARNVRAMYSDEETRADALREFRSSMHHIVKEFASFCKLTAVHPEKMLCSLYVFSRSLEGMLYDIITARMIKKTEEYNRMPLQSTEQIYAGIEVNIPDDYTYNENTTVFVFDTLKKQTGMIELSAEQADVINEITPICRGTTLYDMYTGKLDI